MAVEQLRRAVPGGIGAYARGLLGGIAQCAVDGDDIDLSLLASRIPGPLFPRGTQRADPLANFGRPVLVSHLPGPLLTRAWDHGWGRAPAGFDVVHSVSLAFPLPARGGRERSVVTVHDLAWCPRPARP